MPRGIYDRSKSKAQRASEKSSVATTPTETKKRGRKSAIPGVETVTGGMDKLTYLANYISLLANTFAVEGLPNDVQAKIGKQISVACDQTASVFNSVFGPIDTKTTETFQKVPTTGATNSTKTAPQAPVAFNPPNANFQQPPVAGSNS